MADDTTTTPPEASATGTAQEDPTFRPATPTVPQGAQREGDEGKLGDGGLKALQAERQARREAEQRLKELEPLAQKYREFEDSQKTEVQRLNERLSAAEQRAQKAELTGLRIQVAAAAGLTPEQAARLQGGTREELEADASALKELFAPAPTSADRPAVRTPVAQLQPGATPPDTSGPADMNAWMRNKAPTTN